MISNSILKQITSIAKQRGSYLFGMSIAMLAGTIISIGSAKLAISNMNISKGTTIGNQLQLVNSALSTYISNNTNSLIAGDPIARVANPLTPAVDELKTIGLLSSNVSSTPSYGGSYKTNISITPSGCTTNCQLEGRTWLSSPVRAIGNAKADIHLLTAAMKASPNRQIGFSAPSATATISGPGWTTTNPDPEQRAGILLATTSVNTSTNTQYWLKSAPTKTSLPTSGNNLGDGRLAQDTNKPYSWNGTEWLELFAYKAPSGNPSMSIGPNSGNITGGQENVFIGPNSGLRNINAYQNVFLGSHTGLNITSGGANTFAGFQAGRNISTAYGNTFVGAYAGDNSQGDVGYNTYIGKGAGSWAKGSGNTYLGGDSGPSSGGGSDNIAIGVKALGSGVAASTALNGNIAIGNYSQQKSNTFGNISLGHWALAGLNSGTFNIAIGSGALSKTTQSIANVAIGEGAMISSASGDVSTAVGHNSLYRNISGAENSAFGGNALSSNTSGSYNLAAGRAAGGSNTTGNFNVMLGYNAGPSSGNLSNTIALGTNTAPSASNTAIIGNNSMTQIGGSVAWSNLSDARLKKGVVDSHRGLEFINKLRSVDYILKSNGKRETGFIAQEVEAIDSSFEGINKPTSDQDFYSLTYTDFIPSIVKSIQEVDLKTNVFLWMFGVFTFLFGIAIIYLYRRISILEKRLRILEVTHA